MRGNCSQSWEALGGFQCLRRASARPVRISPPSSSSCSLAVPAGFLLATILGTVCLAIASGIYLLVSSQCRLYPVRGVGTHLNRSWQVSCLPPGRLKNPRLTQRHSWCLFEILRGTWDKLTAETPTPGLERAEFCVSFSAPGIHQKQQV